MRRGVRIFPGFSVVLAGHALSLAPLGCGEPCSCQGDECTNCNGSTPTAPAPDTGAAVIGDATTEAASPLVSAGDAGSPNQDGSLAAIDAGVGFDADGANDDHAVQGSGATNDGGVECITGCSRSSNSCATPDPPVQWTCTGPGIMSATPFQEAGCTSVPINSVAWCCPATFLSGCVCTPGQDWTCNDDPAISSIHGMCLPNHSCSCTMGFALNPATGRCK